MTQAVRMSMIVAALACLALPAAGADRLLPAGDARAAWVIRQNAPSQYDVVAKPVGEKWRWIAYDLPGEPLAAAALDSRLHVLLGGGGYLVFDLDSDRPAPGLKPNHPRWPWRANVLALCAAGPLARVQGQRTIVAVVGAASAPATTSRAASAPASGPPATGPAPQGLAIFCLQGGRWTYLEDAPASAGVAGQRVLAAAFDGQLYLLLFTSEQTQMLVRDRSGAWLAPRAMTELLPPGTTPLALLSNKDSLLLARLHKGASASRPLVDEVSLIAIEKDLKASAPQAIALPATARVTGVQAIAYADGVALVWPGAPAPGFAPCDPTGHVKTVEAVELLAQRPNDGRAEEAWRYFLYTLFALFLLSTFLRMRQGRVLFSLPPGLRPARLPRRALACLVDFIPFSLLGYQLFPFALPEAVNSTAEFVDF
ncbi:MAG: hypothetical protein NT031_01135, partial [Planctomycetota bacterium]|nr:hypothetical protein [Planctomycetota bacterium]